MQNCDWVTVTGPTNQFDSADAGPPDSDQSTGRRDALGRQAVSALRGRARYTVAPPAPQLQQRGWRARDRFARSAGMTAAVRSAMASDAEAIARIYNYYIANTVITFEEEPVSPATIATRVADIQGANLPSDPPASPGRTRCDRRSRPSERSKRRSAREARLRASSDVSSGRFQARQVGRRRLLADRAVARPLAVTLAWGQALPSAQ